MSLSQTVANSAAWALNALGVAGTLSRSSLGVYDPAVGSSPVSTSVYSVSAVLDASSLQGLGSTFGAGLVQAGDVKATLASPVEPMLGDILALPIGLFSVKSVRPTYVGGTAVIYECLVTK